MTAKANGLKAAVGAALLALTVAAPAAGAQTPDADPCNGIEGCRVQLEPWTVVPARDASGPGSAQHGAICEGLVPAAGIAADLGNGFQGPVYIDLVLQAYYPQYFRSFEAFNSDGQPVSFRPKLGCLDADAAATRARALGSTLRGRTIAVAPRQRSRHRIRCRPGERLLGRGAALQFLTHEQPTRRELRQVDLRSHAIERGIAVDLSVGPRVSDDERVRLAIHLHCVRA